MPITTAAQRAAVEHDLNCEVRRASAIERCRTCELRSPGERHSKSDADLVRKDDVQRAAVPHLQKPDTGRGALRRRDRNFNAHLQ